MRDRLQDVEKLLMGFVLRKQEERKLITDINFQKEIDIQLECADLFNNMIGLVKQCH